MKTTVKINFRPSARPNSAESKVRKHTLSKCGATGLARYRDRHQARDGAKALAAGSHDFKVTMFACPD